MSEVYVKENESLDNALKRFKRSCAKAGVLADLRKKEYYRAPASSAARRAKQHARTRISVIINYAMKIPHRRMRNFFAQKQGSTDRLTVWRMIFYNDLMRTLLKRGGMCLKISI